MNKSSDFPTPLYQEKFYGRRKGRPLRKDRQDALAMLNSIGIDKDIIASSNPALAEIKPSSLFPSQWVDHAANGMTKQYCLEIGFGNGDFLAMTHEKTPEIGYIGAEPFMNGVTALLKNIIDHDDHSNIRIWPDDVRPLLKKLAPSSLDKVMVLNPDPWPKKRHHKRRIINQENLNMLARIMKPGAQLFMTTDIAELAEWMIVQVVNHPDFSWPADNPGQSLIPPDGWQATRYELKGKEAGRQQFYLSAIRNNS